jgi:hypothetical protein
MPFNPVLGRDTIPDTVDGFTNPAGFVFDARENVWKRPDGSAASLQEVSNANRAVQQEAAGGGGSSSANSALLGRIGGVAAGRFAASKLPSLFGSSLPVPQIISGSRVAAPIASALAPSVAAAPAATAAVPTAISAATPSIAAPVAAGTVAAPAATTSVSGALAASPTAISATAPSLAAPATTAVSGAAAPAAPAAATGTGGLGSLGTALSKAVPAAAIVAAPFILKDIFSKEKEPITLEQVKRGEKNPLTISLPGFDTLSDAEKDIVLARAQEKGLLKQAGQTEEGVPTFLIEPLAGGLSARGKGGASLPGSLDLLVENERLRRQGSDRLASQARDFLGSIEDVLSRQQRRQAFEADLASRGFRDPSEAFAISSLADAIRRGREFD